MMTFSLHIQVGGMWVKCWRFWLPDGLHIWIGGRGVHLFWSKSRFTRRIEFDRLEDDA